MREVCIRSIPLRTIGVNMIKWQVFHNDILIGETQPFEMEEIISEHVTKERRGIVDSYMKEHGPVEHIKIKFMLTKANS